jgi:hypothetical protein
MISKIFEVRSPATLIVIIATKLKAENQQTAALLSHSGYGQTNKDIERYILVTAIDGGGGGIATTDAYKHHCEELRVAHIYINEHFSDLENGSVLDVDYIRGTSDKPKKSDMDFMFQDWIRRVTL